MVVPFYAYDENFRVLAHELGHVCGLTDIYDEHVDLYGTLVTVGNDLVRSIWEPLDWNDGSSPAYYAPTLKQADLIKRLLMYGGPAYLGVDIPRGSIYGVDTTGFIGLQAVGLSAPMNRIPIQR